MELLKTNETLWIRLIYDLDAKDLKVYKRLEPRWHDWQAVKSQCQHLAVAIARAIVADR